jgi:hypothetical protein
MSERIISAAIHLGGLVLSLPSPARHHTLINSAAQKLEMKPPILGIQGFLTSTGRFVNRKEACFIATEAGQIMVKTGSTDELYSEDLW